MESQMSAYKATANVHMRRDLDAQRKWACNCEACQAIRSLVGMDKTVRVRDLVRQVVAVEEQLAMATDDASKQSLMNDYLRLYDELGNEMSK